ncbi:MAG: exodeoxyribonuclease VII small subunit [Ruminococcus sp.]|nr:exodeoxyribonuclease VII small subunit [Ruminococcus sp.]
MSFEKSVKEIDQIIERLSSGDIPLEEAAELYKKGALELDKCSKLLEQAEKSVMKITSSEEM